MSALLFVEQTLNGLQFGVMLFLMAAGLTLIFGIMDVINLAHGSLYMAPAPSSAPPSPRARARSSSACSPVPPPGL